METLLQQLWSDESGQDLVEYVLIIVLVALAVVAALEFLGGAITQVFNNAGSELQGASS